MECDIYIYIYTHTHIYLYTHTHTILNTISARIIKTSHLKTEYKPKMSYILNTPQALENMQHYYVVLPTVSYLHLLTYLIKYVFLLPRCIRQPCKRVYLKVLLRIAGQGSPQTWWCLLIILVPENTFYVE
jgi:hypothetical protein